MPRVSFNRDYIARANRPKQFARNWLSLLLLDVEVQVSERAGHIMLVLTNGVLKEHGNAATLIARPKIRHWLTLPLTNDEREGHSPPDSALDLTRQFFRACGISTPMFPRRDKATRGWTYDGARISDDEAEQLRLEASEAICAKAAEFYADPAQLKGYNYYGLVVPDKEYNKIKAMRQDLPPGVSIPDAETGEFFVRT